ncbi:MAG TPA: hypothetical protein VEG44_06695 [Candidatus Acidoferrales bacterium]|nr:hypothetical protein [Candidatus Acidoferrales bacterium]
MKLKVAIVVSLALITCIVAAGCTSNMTTSPNPAQTESNKGNQTGHDKILSAVIADDKQAYVNAVWTKTVNNDVQWTNDTSAMVTFRIGYSKGVLNYTAKYIKFPTISDANAFVKSISSGYNNTNALTLSSDPALTIATSGNTHENYKKVTNMSPTTLSYVKLVHEEPAQYENQYIIQTGEVVATYDAVVHRV